jgi:hypothetical protein
VLLAVHGHELELGANRVVVGFVGGRRRGREAIARFLYLVLGKWFLRFMDIQSGFYHERTGKNDLTKPY